MTRHVIGVDLGGTKVEACLLEQDRKLYGRERIFSEAHLGLDQVVGKIIRLIQKVSGGRTFSAVGMGTPGTYIPDKDRIYGSPHTLTYETPGFISRIRENLAVPLIVENDANCLAIAEFFETCKGRYSHVMAVILGTGVGFGLILDDKLYRGSKGGGGEIGHTTVDYRGRPCECGRQGCIEAYLSGPSLSRRFFDLTGRKLSVQEIYRLYESGDRPAGEMFEESCRIMGEAFANVINALDLEAIILGGGVSNLPLWYKKVPTYIKQSLFGVPRGKVPLIKAKLGDSAGVFGAAYLALRELGILDF